VVGLDDERMYRAYPHQLSGGQRQRVLVAQAIACKPRVLIADEPTASLDATSARDVLLLLRELVRKYDTALLLITHEPGVIAEFADHVIVLYDGQIVEESTVHDLFTNPKHPYTRQLLACRHPLGESVAAPNNAETKAKRRWPVINRDALTSGSAGSSDATRGRDSETVAFRPNARIASGWDRSDETPRLECTGEGR
jgi:ABC-type dipeptide/oligopeptide/nickel transport system ATPase component